MEASEGSQSSPARSRRRLSRTFSRARWPEYGRLLKASLGAGYQAVTLEDFFDGGVRSERGPILILRHDVDQHPGSALMMSDVEVELGLRSTWYFRWRTANQAVIEELKRRGGEIGLHYETLSREVLRSGSPEVTESVEGIEAARDRLREEITIFSERFGPIRSVAAHGDTRVPTVRNGVLLRDQEWSDFGIEYDANDAMRRHRLAAWLTDRSSADGGWSDDLDPYRLLRDRETPILCLTHPNNWVSGGSLWRDRLIGAALRRRGDAPPTP
ncbi:MAG TPA: hypothetical protein VN758_14560 [Solirubrobacterales bacterium]|nr:hypothetical protein [Solirubrobacterales bacterium]